MLCESHGPPAQERDTPAVPPPGSGSEMVLSQSPLQELGSGPEKPLQTVSVTHARSGDSISNGYGWSWILGAPNTTCPWSAFTAQRRWGQTAALRCSWVADAWIPHAWEDKGWTQL
ncbi:hypothetical protein AAY473_039216 [Plecturocebus cupreus]